MLNFETEYLKLNKAQKDAVDTIYGPIMVIAGPGTGKTQIIGLRTANILKKTDIDPKNILITTFTEAGVISVKKRLFNLIGTESYKINVCTIHSFCNDVIQTFPEKFLKYRASRSIDEIEQIEILEQILLEGNYEFLSSSYDPFFYLSSIKDKITKLKQENIDPIKFDEIILSQSKDYEEELFTIDQKLKKYENTKITQEKHINKLKELNQIYSKYIESCEKLGVYDFADMIEFVLKEFKKDENLRYYYAELYQFIMVDEYQDTNNTQNEIVDIIMSVNDDKNILVVGDDDQSIFRFQGANLENMLFFSKKYQNTKFIILTENYRSTQNILDLSSKSISTNKSRISNYIQEVQKDLKSNLKLDILPRFFALKNDLEEKILVLENIIDLQKKNPDLRQEDFAIIVRTNKEVQEWTDFLQNNGIFVESKIKSNILKSYFVNLLLDLLVVINNPYLNETKLINLMRSQLFKFDKFDILHLNKYLYSLNYVRKDKLKIFDIITDSRHFDKLDFRNKDEFDNFLNNVLEVQKSLGINFYSFFKNVLEKFEFIKFIEKNGNFTDLEDIFTLLNIVKSWFEGNKNLDLESFIKKINYYIKYNISINRHILKASISGVQILTAHQSKGLEYEAVFIPSLYEGNWGGKKVVNLIKLPFGVVGSNLSESVNKETSEEEEKRLFYVAITRAKKYLNLSFPYSIQDKLKLQSKFLQELNIKYEDFPIKDTEKYLKNEFSIITKIKENLDKEEELYIKEFLQNYKLSPSDLNKFLEDPNLFLKESIFKYPFEDNEFTIFGRVYHKTLEYFYLEFKKTGVRPDFEYLKNTFNRLIEKEILSPEQNVKIKEKALSGLEGWLKININTPIPLELEYDFRPKNVVFEGIPITGKIDKIELLNKEFALQSNHNVILVDYKTGKTKTLNEIKGTTQNSDSKYFRQLLFYKILCDYDKTFSSKYTASGLAIEFVEGKNNKYSLVEVDFTDENIETTKQEIRDSWQKINDLNFWRKQISN